MRSSFRFSSLAVVGLIIGMVVVGVGLAQLTIPTTLTNATIYIKDLLVTSDGTSSTNPQITLNGANGILAIKSLVNTPILGTNANGEVIVQTSQVVYNYIANQVSGAITTAISGALNTGNNNGTGGNSSGEENVFKRSSTNPEDTYFADTSGSNARVGRDDSYLRIGVDPGTPDSNNRPDLALVVGGSLESRGGLVIKKHNTEPIANTGVNKNIKLTSNFTSLTATVGESGEINFESRQKNSLGSDQPTYFKLNAVGNTTKVGINTLTLPTATLDIANTLSTNGTTALSLDSKIGNGSSNASAASISHTRTNNAYDASLNLGTVNSSFVATQKVKIASSGDSYINGGYLGIGLTDPQVALHVSGDVRANAYYYNSDRTLKTNIRVIDNALDMVRQLHGYTFTWKADGKKAIGLIAQEVEKIFPDLVNTDAQGIKSVQYGNLVAPLIEAVRTLADRVDALFAKYIDQQKRIDDLEARIARLEALSDVH